MSLTQNYRAAPQPSARDSKSTTSKSAPALNIENANNANDANDPDVRSSLTPAPADDDVVAQQVQPRSGILTVILHEGVGISLPEGYKQLLEARNHRQGGDPMEITVPPTLDVDLDNSGAHKPTTNSYEPKEATSKSRTDEAYAVLEVEKTQVLVHAYSGTRGSPQWSGHSYKFDIASNLVDFSAHLYLNNSLPALGSGSIQDVYLGVAQVRLGIEAPNVTEPVVAEHHQQGTIPYKGWLEVQHGTGKIRVSVDFEENKTKLLQMQDFELLKLLRKSSSGRTLQVRKRDSGRLYALKEIRKTSIISQETEAAGMPGMVKQSVLHQVKNPFLVPLKFTFQSPEILYLISAFVPGEELFAVLHKEQCFDVDTIRFYTAEILCALEYLHDFGVTCGDLRPRNILLDYTGHISICDFGLYELYPKNTISSPYLAPEIIFGHAYTEVVDWWTLGILLAEMLTQLDPLWYDEETIISPDVKISSFYFPDADVGLSPAQDLSIRLFNHSPKHRLGANGVAEIKAHSFFTDVNWRTILKRECIPVFKSKEAPMVFDTHPQDLGFALISREEAQKLSEKAIVQWHAQWHA